MKNKTFRGKQVEDKNRQQVEGKNWMIAFNLLHYICYIFHSHCFLVKILLYIVITSVYISCIKWKGRLKQFKVSTNFLLFYSFLFYFIRNLQTTHEAIWSEQNSAIKQWLLFIDAIFLSIDEEESGDNVRIRRAEERESSKQRG